MLLLFVLKSGDRLHASTVGIKHHEHDFVHRTSRARPQLRHPPVLIQSHIGDPDHPALRIIYGSVGEQDLDIRVGDRQAQGVLEQARVPQKRRDTARPQDDPTTEARTCAEEAAVHYAGDFGILLITRHDDNHAILRQRPTRRLADGFGCHVQSDQRHAQGRIGFGIRLPIAVQTNNRGPAVEDLTRLFTGLGVGFHRPRPRPWTQ
jgi:hypothetical protein